MSGIYARTLLRADLARLLPPRGAESNKGTYGRVLAVCGSRGMSGAAYLCAKAAYRTGCGLVEILTPEDNRVILQTLLPEAVITCYDPAAPDVEQLTAAVGRADSIAVGCGLGQSDAAFSVLKTLLRTAAVPAVLDADALNLLAARAELWKLINVPAVITPHPGEMSRLTGVPVTDILSDTLHYAAELAAERGVVCVLKSHATVTSDGRTAYLNRFGNNGMATGGSGDVLCGIIASLLAQGREKAPALLEAAALGVMLHSLAGDAAAADLGEYSLMARDIIDRIPTVLRQAQRVTD